RDRLAGSAPDPASPASASPLSLTTTRSYRRIPGPPARLVAALPSIGDETTLHAGNEVARPPVTGRRAVVWVSQAAGAGPCASTGRRRHRGGQSRRPQGGIRSHPAAGRCRLPR